MDKAFSETLRSRSFIISYQSIISIICLCFLIPQNVEANGAIGHATIDGSDVTVSSSKPFNEFIVDEDVIIDFPMRRVKVKYNIYQSSPVTENLKMIFPIESNFTCDELEKRLGDYYSSPDELIDFKAVLNNISIPVERVKTTRINFEGDYKNLKESSCSFMAFNVQIKPGKNTLLLDYNLVQGEVIFSTSYHKGYSYLIWPAQNWVKKFRKAFWRVILPELNDDEYHHQYGDWYTRNPDPGVPEMSFSNWSKSEVKISGPGIRKNYPDHVDFTATDYVPTGQVSIEYNMDDILDMTDGICRASSYKLCLQSVLKLRPFTGDKRCYHWDDLVVSPTGYGWFEFDAHDVPFLRNEIFARKGYIFESEPLKKFFSEMPWYVPKYRKVQLNEIERWNVSFLKKVENEIKSDHEWQTYPDELVHVYEQSLVTCPTKSSTE